MNKLRIYSHLTGLLALNSAGEYLQRSRLGEWLDTYVPKLTDAARAILTPPFAVGELNAFADVAVVAAQKLKESFAGLDRAKVAQVIFSEAARAVLPDGPIEDAAVGLIESEISHGIIEAAFQRVFGPQADPEARARAEGRLNDPQATTTDATLPEPSIEAAHNEDGARPTDATPAAQAEVERLEAATGLSRTDLNPDDLSAEGPRGDLARATAAYGATFKSPSESAQEAQEGPGDAAPAQEAEGDAGSPAGGEA